MKALVVHRILSRSVFIIQNIYRTLKSRYLSNSFRVIVVQIMVTDKKVGGMAIFFCCDTILFA